MADDDIAAQELAWSALYKRIQTVLARFGFKENAFGQADYLLVDDNYGWKRHTIEAHALDLYHPRVVAALRSLLDHYPDWDVGIAAGIRGHDDWPLMGVTIRKREIIDGLQRNLLPEKYRAYQYPDSRVGTGFD